MAKKTGPYIGVAGFMTPEEVTDALRWVRRGSDRRLMVGVLMDPRTLAGQANERPARYPKREAVSGIFPNDPRTLNLVHYRTGSDHPDPLSVQLEEITELAGPNLDGIQIIMPRPPVSELRAYAQAHPDMVLVLQISSRTLAQMSSATQFAEIVGQYIPVIDAVLLDPNDGRVMPFNSGMAAECLRAVGEHAVLGIGIKGDFGPDSLHVFDPLIPEFPHLSVDVEEWLRFRMPQDTMCPDAVRRHLQDAFRIFAGEELPGTQLHPDYVHEAPYGFEEHVRWWKQHEHAPDGAARSASCHTRG